MDRIKTFTPAKDPPQISVSLRLVIAGGTKADEIQRLCLQEESRYLRHHDPSPSAGLDHNPAHPRHAATSASAGRLSGRGRFRRGGGGRSTCASTCSNSAG